MSVTIVTQQDIQRAIELLELADMPICIHSSLRSFGRLENGAQTVVDGFLAEGCTVLVPTFTNVSFGITPPDRPEMRPACNGIRYADLATAVYLGHQQVYTTDSLEIDLAMGTLPAYVVEHPSSIRGNHPLNSFAALGPLAETLLAGQDAINVYAPLHTLTLLHGSIVLMGVGLERMTFLHYAEQMAGRELFRRWANGTDLQPQLVAVGSCSEGFGRLSPVLATIGQSLKVGLSLWQTFAAGETLQAACHAIREQPQITHCADVDCVRCRDAIKGGPLLR